MNQDKNDELVETVLKMAKQGDGKMELPCADALELAAQYGVEPLAVARICNRENIKIRRCQLGCFR